MRHVTIDNVMVRLEIVDIPPEAACKRELDDVLVVDDDDGNEPSPESSVSPSEDPPLQVGVGADPDVVGTGAGTGADVVMVVGGVGLTGPPDTELMVYPV